QQIGFKSAMLTSIQRSEGAAAANNRQWVLLQNQAAQADALQLATLLGQEPQLRANLLSTLQQPGVATTTVSADAISAYQGSVTTSGLPSSFVQSLTQAGADSAMIAQAQQSFVSVDAVAIPSTATTLQQE